MSVSSWYDKVLTCSIHSCSFSPLIFVLMKNTYSHKLVWRTMPPWWYHITVGGKEKICLTHNCAICISNLMEHALTEYGNPDNANTFLNELTREQIFDQMDVQWQCVLGRLKNQKYVQWQLYKGRLKNHKNVQLDKLEKQFSKVSRLTTTLLVLKNFWKNRFNILHVKSICAQ